MRYFQVELEVISVGFYSNKRYLIQVLQRWLAEEDHL